MKSLPRLRIGLELRQDDKSASHGLRARPGIPNKIRETVERVAKGESVHFPLLLQGRPVKSFMNSRCDLLFDRGGKVVALVPESIDVTTRVRAEQALQQAQKMEAIGNLTGGIAHDFSNLLMAVLGSLELLRRRLPPDDRLLRLLDNAAESARRGKSLTGRMLAFALRQDLQPERVSLVKLIGDMAELMERSLGPSIAIDAQVPADSMPVEMV